MFNLVDQKKRSLQLSRCLDNLSLDVLINFVLIKKKECRLSLCNMFRWWSLALFFLKVTLCEWSSTTSQLMVLSQFSPGKNSLRRMIRLLQTFVWLKSLKPSTVFGWFSLSGPQYRPIVQVGENGVCQRSLSHSLNLNVFTCRLFKWKLVKIFGAAFVIFF